ncbi:MAG: lytic transglycosylase domain-containing protein [bacterium]
MNRKTNSTLKVLTGVCVLVSLWLAQLTNAQVVKRYPYQSCFEVAAAMHKVPLDLLLAVAATESNWDADAVSKANAHGIMQIQWPGTARHLGVRRLGELYNPCLNISLGAQYLNELLHTFESDTQSALAAYNYGPTRISASKELPEGARRYAAKVLSKQSRIKKGLVPKALQPKSHQDLVIFDSRLRAHRLAARLNADIQGATVDVVKQAAGQRGYAVVLNVGQGGLTVQDHVMLRNMGWALP